MHKKCCNCTNTSTIDAHIIPKSFYDLEPDVKPLQIVSDTKQGLKRKRSPIGIYDKNILCKKCDGVLNSLYDDYAYSHLVADFSSYVSKQSIANEIIIMEDTSAKIIKNFILSMLWRASVSTDPFFLDVSLGNKHENRIRDIIFRKQSTLKDEYQIVLCKYYNTVGFLLQKPNKERMDGMTFYMFFFNYYWAVIKVDNRNISNSFSNIAIDEESSLKILPLNFKETKRFNQIVNYNWNLK